MFETKVRPNGNLTIREYRNGILTNKLVEKGQKVIISGFRKDGKLIQSRIYDNKDRMTLYGKSGEKIAEIGSKVTYLNRDRKLNPLEKMIYEISQKNKKDFKIIKKGGEEYIRQCKPLPFMPETKFTHKIIDKFTDMLFRNIKIEYAQESLKKIRFR